MTLIIAVKYFRCMTCVVLKKMADMNHFCRLETNTDRQKSCNLFHA